MAKTKRLREKIKSYLELKPRNTVEIEEHINSTMRNGTTSSQLGNILSKDSRTFSIGKVAVSGILSGGYDIYVWATFEWVIKNQNPEKPSEVIYQPPVGNPISYSLSDSALERIRSLQESGLETSLED